MALKDKQSRTIVLSIKEVQYPQFVEDNEVAHQLIQRAYSNDPELFPPQMEHGYKLNGKTRRSKKLGLCMRRIEIGGATYRLRPSFVLPYMRGKTDDLKHPLFLLRFGVPFWALAYVFGRNAMFWYRAFICLGRFSIVGTSVHHADNLPLDLLADEFHTRIKGVKSYIATTIGRDCILGVQASATADQAGLTAAYATFKQEAQVLDPLYEPTTVNTDG